MQPIRLDNAFGSPYAGQQAQTPPPLPPRVPPQPPPASYAPPQQYYMPAPQPDAQVSRTLAVLAAEVEALKRKAKAQKGKLKKARKAALQIAPPPPKSSDVSVSTVLWGGLFLLLLAVLIIVIVQMVKTDASVTSIHREHDNMRQWVHKLSYSNSNTHSATAFSNE